MFKIKSFYSILLILTIVTLISSSIGIALKKYSNYLKEKEYYRIESVYQEINYLDSPSLIDKYQVIYNNQDIKAILKLGDNFINTVVVQGENNTFYLNHLLNKEKNEIGTAFIDYAINLDDTNKVIIYGHNSLELKTVFNGLDNYLDFNFFLKNKDITLITGDEVAEYEIFSVMKTINNYDYAKIDFIGEEFNQHILELKNSSLYDTGIDVKGGDQILILQTCLFDDEKSLLVICARKVN